MLSPQLRDAFKYHRGLGRNARRALDAAREDVATNKRRYPSEIWPLVCWQYGKRERAAVQQENPYGLRFIGRTAVNDGCYWSVWDKHNDQGYYTDPYGDVFEDGMGLCWGEVWQLPGAKGRARYVAGYRFGGCDCGLTLDLSEVFDAPGEEHEDAAKEAARHADQLAERAAEKEREYQCAWQAGARYANERDAVASLKTELRDLLRERRKAKAEKTQYPAMCAAIENTACHFIDRIQKARDAMRDLANGDAENLCFWPGDENLRAAFCDGAGLSQFPDL